MDGQPLTSRKKKNMKAILILFFMAAFLLLLVNTWGFCMLQGAGDLMLFLRSACASLLTMLLSAHYLGKC